MTRLRALGLTAALTLAMGVVWIAIGALVMPEVMTGALGGDTRRTLTAMAVRLDSLEEVAKASGAGYANLIGILRGDSAAVRSASVSVEASGLADVSVDSLVEASEAERRFVTRFEEDERLNLSVLAPVAAEGMTFYSPVPDAIAATATTDGTVIAFRTAATTGVSAIYRGTVVDIHPDEGSGETMSITIQHPNDFLSQYSGLGELAVRRGDKVAAGARIALGSADTPLRFALWHNGAALDPEEYISF